MIINLLMGADVRGIRVNKERWFRCIVYLGWTSCSYWAFFMAHVLVRLLDFYMIPLNCITCFFFCIVVCLGL